MKNSFIIVLICLFGLFIPNAIAGNNQNDPEILNICTFNIRHDLQSNEPDSISWDEPTNRKNRVLNLITEYDFDLIGGQEITYNQLQDILTLPYKDHGVVVNTGLRTSSGMRNAIFYKSNRFITLEQGTFWLSETPEVVSKGWDADQHRNCSWAKIKDLKTGKIFYFFNAHFDHLGVQARANSAKLIVDMIPKIAGDFPAFFMGDLNSVETSEPITILNAGLNDSRSISLAEPMGPYGTGHGWRINVNVRRIDYIYTYNGNGRERIEVQEYEVIDKTYDGKAPSDHWPVRIKIRFVPGLAAYAVNSKADDGSPGTLRHILSGARSGDSIYIDRTIVDTIKLTSPLTIDRNIRLNGNGAVIQVQEPGKSTFRIFNIGADTEKTDTISISDMTLIGGDISAQTSTNGNGGILLINKNTLLKVTKTDFQGGKAIYGGAVFCVDTTNVQVSMKDCRFTANNALNNAGAFYIKARNASIDNCIFENNSTARNGSAIVSNRHAIITNCTFKNNISTTSVSTDYGAAIFNTGGGYLSVLNSTFDSNQATQYGTGAFACSGTTTRTTITNSTFRNNSGKISSVLYNRAGSIDLINSTVAGNKTEAETGAAFYVYPAVEAKNKLFNSILAYNYNYNGTSDLFVSENAVVTGTNNIIGTLNGVTGLINPISFEYAQGQYSIFDAFENSTFNTKTIAQPVLNFHGGSNKTIAINEQSIAYRAGIATSADVTIPGFDQRNFTRYHIPCIGAYELTCDYPHNLTVGDIESTSVTLGWQASSGNFEVAFAQIDSAKWDVVFTGTNQIEITGLAPNTTYKWKVRNRCEADFYGDWAWGSQFSTPYRLRVISGADDGEEETLRYILNNALPGDSIVIAVDTITLTSPLEITKNIIISGQGAVIKPLQSGTSDYRVFTLGTNTTETEIIRLNNLELQGGDISAKTGSEGNGGIMFLNKNIQLYAENIVFKYGKAVYGGAIHCNDSNGVRIQMERCSFIDNESTNNAGAFYIKAVASLNRCHFSGNKTGSNGSAITTIHKVHIRDAEFLNNRATGNGTYGAAVFNTSGGILTIENSTFESNTVTTNGAGAFGSSAAGTTTNFVNCTFWGNNGVVASVFYNRAGTVNMAHCTVAGNIAKAQNAPAFFDYDATNVFSNFANNIFAYNYNSSGPNDISLATTSETYGTNNLISFINLEKNLENTIPFAYGLNEPPLFAEHMTIENIKVPVLKNNGGETKTVALSGIESIAFAAGISSYLGYNAPEFDQRGLERNMPPCIGSYEYDAETGLITTGLITTHIFPNPAQDHIYIKTDSNFYKADLYAISGIKISTFTSNYCNLNFLSKGTYLIRIYTQKGISTQKLIVN